MDSRQVRHVNIPATDLSYEAPGIETVLTSEDVEREIFYAGGLTFPWTNIPD